MVDPRVAVRQQDPMKDARAVIGENLIGRHDPQGRVRNRKAKAPGAATVGRVPKRRPVRVARIEGSTRNDDLTGVGGIDGNKRFKAPFIVGLGGDKCVVVGHWQGADDIHGHLGERLEPGVGQEQLGSEKPECCFLHNVLLVTEENRQDYDAELVFL